MNNNIIYNTITENINERKDDLDLGKSNSSNVKKKENNKEILINASVIKGGDNIYNFFKDNSVTIITVENRLKKYKNEKKKENNINSAMIEYLEILRNKMEKADINALDEDDFEEQKNFDNFEENEEKEENEDNENNMTNKDLFSNFLMIDELKNQRKRQREENFNFLIEKIKFNYNLVTYFVNKIITNIKDNLISFPYYLKCISKAIHILLKAKYNNKSKNQLTSYQLYTFELNFLIGNIILPIIRDPEFNGVISNDVISAYTNENLKIISKVLNKMIKGTLFIKSKESNMTMFNRYIIDTMPKLFELMDIIEQKFNEFDEPNIVKNLLNTSDKCNLPERNINYDYFKENPKENINYQIICFCNLISSNLNETINKCKNKFIDENTNDKQKEIIQNFLNIKYSEENKKNEHEFIYITKIDYSKEFNQRLEIMNLNNLITKKPNEKNDLIFTIKKYILETLKIAKKIMKENSYDLRINKGLDDIDFRKDLLPQIMNKISFIINNNTENEIYKNLIFLVNYLNLNMNNIPNDYKDKNYSLLFDDLISETKMNIDNLETNIIMEFHNKFKVAEKNNNIIKHYASQMYNLKKFKYFEYLYNKIQLPIKFIIEKDSKQIINNIKYECPNKKDELNYKKTSTINENNNIIDYVERKAQPIKNMIEAFPDFHDYEDEYDNILDIEAEAGTVKAIADYFASLSDLIKGEKIFKQFKTDEEKNNLIYKFENYILIQLYDKLFPFQETVEDVFFYRKCQRLSFIRPENIKDMKVNLEDDKWEKAINSLKEIDEKCSPIDKIECMVKSLKIIQDAINFSSGKFCLGVDDILEQLKYALIKACPKNINSNYNYCDLYLNEILKLGSYGSSLSLLKVIIDKIKEMKCDDLVGVTEEQFGKDEMEEIINNI